MNQMYSLAFHVVTEGREGCTLYEGARCVTLPACPPDAEVDATGAGDAFAGAFLAEYLETGDARAAAEIGLVVSSFVVERLGCQENVPSADQVRERRRRFHS